MKKSIFVFHKHKIPAEGGDSIHWDIRVKADGFLNEWNIYEDPLNLDFDAPTEVRVKKCFDLSWLEAQGKRKVGGIWTEVEMLDKGEVLINQESKTKITFKFQGKNLRGKWILERARGRWTFTRI